MPSVVVVYAIAIVCVVRSLAGFWYIQWKPILLERCNMAKVTATAAGVRNNSSSFIDSCAFHLRLMSAVYI